jgi:CheY-like chemotaxis protein
VLIIDDDVTSAAALDVHLSPGYDTLRLSAPSTALELLLRDGTFDVVLCRLWMPELSGAELYAQLQQRLPEQARRMIFMMGDAEREQLELSRLPSALRGRVLPRPFPMARLLAMIEAARPALH